MIPRPCIAFSAALVLVCGLWAPLHGQATGPATVLHDHGQTYLWLQKGPAGEAEPPAIPSGRLIVRLRPGRDQAFLRATPGARKLGGRPDLLLVPVPPGQEAGEAARRLARRAEVLYAEPDATASLALDPNDTRWSEQWNLVKIAAPTAWDTQTDSSDVVVAVLDSGINFSHPDLQNNLWTDPLDGSHGFTCLNGTVTPGGLDDNGHGTHVAGVIGATGNDGLGVAGVNWSVQLLSLKAFNSSGSANISDIVGCLDKLVELKQSGINVRVANHSWSTGAFSQALEDALADAENAGVLHVAAAGNSGANIDLNPEYPAALEGRGILTVAATDASDVPASFTNYGHAAVDLAAPGVGILSTVPSGACISCDASGYKLLSGTSMATPHAAGVAAALFHLNPALTPAEARDILLQPASLDVLVSTSYRGSSTTRGRLNFWMALNHPWVSSPQLNAFPQMTAPGQRTRAAGSTLTLAASASDADGDLLKYQWGKQLKSGLYGNMMNQIFPPGWVVPTVTTLNPYVFTVPSPAIPVTLDYYALVNDGRGGSAQSRTQVNVLANPTPGQPPSGTLTVTPTSGPPGTTVTVSYSGTDPEGGSLLWGYKSGAGGNCCYSTAQTFTYTLSNPGVYRFVAQSIDREMSLSPVSSVAVRIGNPVGDAPVASLTADLTVGVAPLTVSYDATGSYDPDGGTLLFFPQCESSSQSGYTVVPAGPPTGTCTFDAPGPARINVSVLDDSGFWDFRTVYVMVLGSSSPDTQAPTAQIASPADGAAVTGTVTVQALASDDEAVQRVELYRDSGVLLATDTTAPYSVAWNTAGASLGAHTLYAKAYDESGNTATSAAVGIQVSDLTPPFVAIIGPASGLQFPYNSTPLTISVNATDAGGIERVELYRDSGVFVATDTTAPYAFDWVPTTSTPGSHNFYAKAYDLAGNVTTSQIRGWSFNDVTPPAVAITSPGEGAALPAGVTVTVSAAASDDVGVLRVEFYLDSGSSLGFDATAPYSVTWTPGSLSLGSHTVYAVALDEANNTTTSALVSFTVADTSAPAVSMTSPGQGSTLPNNAPVTLSASASDNVGVARVELYRDAEVLLGTDTTAPYSLAWSPAATPLGAHTLYAKAFDAAGNAATSAAVSVSLVDATPPVVSITSPVNGGAVPRNTTITLAASASDDVGVTRVEFLVNGVLTCTDTTSPYTCSWKVPKTNGASYSLQAKAYDARNNVGASTVVQVTAR